MSTCVSMCLSGCLSPPAFWKGDELRLLIEGCAAASPSVLNKPVENWVFALVVLELWCKLQMPLMHRTGGEFLLDEYLKKKKSIQVKGEDIISATTILGLKMPKSKTKKLSNLLEGLYLNHELEWNSWSCGGLFLNCIVAYFEIFHFLLFIFQTHSGRHKRCFQNNI